MFFSFNRSLSLDQKYDGYDDTYETLFIIKMNKCEYL